MTTDTLPAHPAEITEAEHVTADACTTAAWVLVDAAQELLERMEDFTEQFSALATHPEFETTLPHALGLAWALEMFVSCQSADLRTFNDNGEDLRPADEDE